MEKNSKYSEKRKTSDTFEFLITLSYNFADIQSTFITGVNASEGASVKTLETLAKILHILT